MSTEVNNTAAFPEPPEWVGMTLRDYFAAKALSAIVSGILFSSWESSENDDEVREQDIIPAVASVLPLAEAAAALGDRSIARLRREIAAGCPVARRGKRGGDPTLIDVGAHRKWRSGREDVLPHIRQLFDLGRAPFDHVAGVAYKFADAMLATRGHQ